MFGFLKVDTIMVKLKARLLAVGMTVCLQFYLCAIMLAVAYSWNYVTVTVPE